MGAAGSCEPVSWHALGGYFYCVLLTLTLSAPSPGCGKGSPARGSPGPSILKVQLVGQGGALPLQSGPGSPAARPPVLPPLRNEAFALPPKNAALGGGATLPMTTSRFAVCAGVWGGDEFALQRPQPSRRANWRLGSGRPSLHSQPLLHKCLTPPQRRPGRRHRVLPTQALGNWGGGERDRRFPLHETRGRALTWARAAGPSAA